MKQFSRTASVFAVFAALVVAACNSSTTTSVPSGSGPTATPIPAPALPTAAPYTAQQSIAVATPAPGATSVPLALPTGGGVAGTIILPTNGSTIPANTVVTETSQNSVPSGLPALDAFARAPLGLRGALTAGSAAIIQVDTLQFSNQTVLSAIPSFSFVVPASIATATGVTFYIAKYDPQNTSQGWQLGFEGPGVVASGTTTIAFAPSTTNPYIFSAAAPQYFALYAVSAAASAPTAAPATATPTASPAPTATPSAVPTATPTPSPSPTASATPSIGLTTNPTSVELMVGGQPATTTIVDQESGFTGTYAASGYDSSVATVSVSGKTVTVTALAAGTTAVTITSSDSRITSFTVGVTSTTLPVN